MIFKSLCISNYCSYYPKKRIKQDKTLLTEVLEMSGSYKCKHRNKPTYPTFAIPPVLAFVASFSKRSSSSLMRAFNCPMVSACSNVF